jgi:hypothetical protein
VLGKRQVTGGADLLAGRLRARSANPAQFQPRYPSRMPWRAKSDAAEDGEEPKPGLIDRLRGSMLRPVARDGVSTDKESLSELSVEELEAASTTISDRERIIGLVCAPVAAAVAFFIINADIANDPAQYLSSGAPNPKFTSISLYHQLEIILLALAFLTMVTAFWRKRLFLGIALALFGLAVFNLHYWGFGIPFVMAGAWYLVRAYRLTQGLKIATGQGRNYNRPAKKGLRPEGTLPRPSKRYTPPTAPLKRGRKAKPSAEPETS